MNFILAFLEWLQKIHVKKSLQRHITHVYVHITEQSGHSRVENIIIYLLMGLSIVIPPSLVFGRSNAK